MANTDDWPAEEVREVLRLVLAEQEPLWWSTATMVNRVLEKCATEYPERIPCPTDRQIEVALEALYKKGDADKRRTKSSRGRPALEWRRP